MLRRPTLERLDASGQLGRLRPRIVQFTLVAGVTSFEFRERLTLVALDVMRRVGCIRRRDDSRFRVLQPRARRFSG